jgi:hypothetical protein
MPDHKSKAGKPDRSRSNRNEPYEVSDLAMKEGVSAKEVIDAIVKVGPMRKDVVAELRKKTTLRNTGSKTRANDAR